ncbi:MAG: hypothetical protein RMK84_02345 [Oscillochloridaceae bacterium]|nr:hypothetical protein [Chloroflexaceae bacterium]MDW8388943.1 hypothetical protein [Oscillochloridaceae bacterium]
MTSLHRLIAIMTIWIVTGAVLITVFSVSFLSAPTPLWLLLLTALIVAGATFATVVLARAG